MRSSLVLIFGSDAKLAGLLEPLIVEQARCPLRHPRDRTEALDLLRDNPAAVLVMKMGRDVEAEMGLLAAVSAFHPDTAVVVVGEPVHAHLSGLAWDLGAAYVLILPQPREMLPEIVAGLLRPATE